MRPAVVASLLMHAGLALAIALIPRAPTPSPTPDEGFDIPAVRVTLVTESPRRRAALPLPMEPVEPEAETIDALPVPIEATEPEAEIVEAPAESAPGAGSPPEDAAPAVAETDSSSPPAAASDADEAEGVPEIVRDRQRLREAISSSMLTYRRDVREQSLQDCQQYRERYDRWDCPREGEVKSATQERIDGNMDTTFRAYVYGHDRNRRISKDLLIEMDALRPLMEDEGILGTLARQRYYMKAERFEYLNPNLVPRSELLTTGGSIGGPNTGGLLTLMTFGGNGIVILDELLTIGLNGKVSVLDETAAKGTARAFDEDEECDLPPSRQGQKSGGCW